MMHDDEMDARLRDAARGYHEPPPTPRDEMWTRIARARAARSQAGILPLTRRWHAVRLAAAAAVIAAVLLVGVLIGRSSLTGMRPTRTAAGNAKAPASDPARQIAIAPESLPRIPAQTETGGRPGPGTPPAAQEQPGHSAGQAPSGTLIGPERSLDPRTAQKLYQLVALQHFGRTEQLITAFRADVRRGTVDARIASWARDLLSTTRLLIDSPAADDPQMRVLLGDLEVLLARLAHHAGANGTDAQRIDEALGQGELMNRLRDALPASAASEVQGD